MNDLAERLRQIERNPSPDLWEEIASRPAQASPGDRQGVRHRVAAGLVAAVVSIAAFAFLVIAFRSEPTRDAVGTNVAPLTIRVWTTNDPFDVHFSGTFQGKEIDLVGIETPGPDLEYPKSALAELPVGTPIVVEASEGISVSVFELDPAQGQFVVKNGSCLIPGSLRALPGPGETAFFIYAEGKGWGGRQAFRADTAGEGLDHDSALDPTSTIDASKLGLASCDGSTSDRETFAEGTDPLAGRWRLFTQLTEFGPVLGVRIPGQQTFTVELHPLNERNFGLSSKTGAREGILLAQIVAPSVVSAEILLDDGTVIGGDLVELPRGIIGPAKVFVAGFSSKMSVEGQHLDPNGSVIAYGADGEELERRRLAPG